LDASHGRIAALAVDRAYGASVCSVWEHRKTVDEEFAIHGIGGRSGHSDM
jgi:hypothetical protein